MKATFSHNVLQNGINFYVYSTQKFKTVTFHLFMRQDLKKGLATKTALLPFVLRRGTRSFPTTRLLNHHLESLYGTDMGGDVLKRGESHLLRFSVDTINPKYKTGEDILGGALDVFSELILKPAMEEDGFKHNYVEQEKVNLKRNIESLYSDKFNYAIERCFQEMCKNEDFSIYRYGNVGALNQIDNRNLYDYYLKCLSECPIDIFVIGDVEKESVIDRFENLFDFKQGIPKTIKTSPGPGYIDKTKVVEEKSDINQGKLSLGFRTNTRYGDSDFYSLLVYNSILGGGPHSKLFQNVREKMGLAYYAFSRIEKTKGLLLISCGIDFDKYERTMEVIREQLRDIVTGEISDYEFDSAIKSIINTLKETADNPSAIISLYLDGIINDINETPDEIIEKVQKLKKDDISSVAEKIWLDTVFFLNKK